MGEHPGKPGRKTASGVTLPAVENEETGEEKKGPEAPIYLGEYAREVWEIWAPSFEALGIGVGDYPMVEAFCMSYETMRESAEFLKENGRKYQPGESGLWKVYPEVKFMQIAIAEMRQIAPQLGFSPAARTKLPGASGVSDDKKDVQLDMLNLLGE